MRQLLCLSLLVALALAAWARPCLNGPTGLVALPDALITTARVDVAADIVANTNDRAIALRALTGLGRAEIGGTAVLDDLDTYGAHAKVQVIRQAMTTVGLGALYLSNTEANVTGVYLAATADLPPGVQLTGGATWTRLTSGGGAEAVRPYAGARLALPNGMAIVAEYQAKSSDLYESKPLSSLMVVHQRGLYTTSIGVTNAENLLGTEDHHVFAGIAARF